MRKNWKIKMLDGRPVVPDEISEKCQLVVLEFAEPVSLRNVLRNLYDQESEAIDMPPCKICRTGESWESEIQSMLKRFAAILTEEEHAAKIAKEIGDEEPDVS